MMDYLIHFNSNHSPKTGQFIRGDGDNDGIVDDHAHRRKGERRRDPRSHKPENRIGVNSSKNKDPSRVIIPRESGTSNRNRNSRSSRPAINYSQDKNAYDQDQARARKTFATKDPNISANGFIKSNSGKSSNANSAYTSKGSNYVTSVKNVSVRKLVNDEEDKKNQSGYDPMDHRHRESKNYDYMHYNPYQTRSYQTAEDKHQHYVDAVEKGLTNNKSTYTDKYKKTTTR